MAVSKRTFLPIRNWIVSDWIYVYVSICIHRIQKSNKINQPYPHLVPDYSKKIKKLVQCLPGWSDMSHLDLFVLSSNLPARQIRFIHNS